MRLGLSLIVGACGHGPTNEELCEVNPRSRADAAIGIKGRCYRTMPPVAVALSHLLAYRRMTSTSTNCCCRHERNNRLKHKGFRRVLNTDTHQTTAVCNPEHRLLVIEHIPYELQLSSAAMKSVLAAAMASFFLLNAATPSSAADSTGSLDPSTTLIRIRDAAMGSDWAYTELAALTDGIGPRLSGSAQHQAAIIRMAAAMRTLGAQVRLQDIKVPHWVRGEEIAKLVEYPGRPDQVTQTLQLTTLGGSSATPQAGLKAGVIVVHDFDELRARAAEARGKIVLFDVIFDQRLARNGRATKAYGQSGLYRFNGPAMAAEAGAIAALVRSIGGADYRLPHTGMTTWHEKQSPIPCAALSSEDADLVSRLAAKGPVTMSLLLTPKSLPEADSSNVIADWQGTEKPNEYVIVSGHLDSWDLGTGATDDGVGVMAAAGVIEVLKSLNLHARRTIRFIAWTNEENGGRGSKGYFDSVKEQLASQVAAIESDEGAGRSLGVAAAVTRESLSVLKPVVGTLSSIGATILERHEENLGSDIGPLQAAGVPGFAPAVDTEHYFDYHHTAADTLDKVDPNNLHSQVATMAVLAYYLADLADPLPRFSTSTR